MCLVALMLATLAAVSAARASSPSLPASPAPNQDVTHVQLQTMLPISTYQPIDFRVTVANTGTMPVNSLFWVDLYEPTLPPVGTPQSGLAWGAVSNLAPGGSIDVMVRYINGFETTGDHTVRARVDSMAMVTETDEDDNDFTDVLVPVTLSGTPPSPALGTGEVVGYVLEAGFGTGADRARVWCTEQHTWVTVAETYADPEGTFVLTDLPPGIYLLYAERWIGGDYYFGALPMPIIITGDDTIGPVILFIRR
jgi:hypothetical protein